MVVVRYVSNNISYVGLNFQDSYEPFYLTSANLNFSEMAIKPSTELKFTLFVVQNRKEGIVSICLYFKLPLCVFNYVYLQSTATFIIYRLIK